MRPRATWPHVVGTRLLHVGIEGGGPVVVDGYPDVVGAGSSGFELRMILPLEGLHRSRRLRRARQPRGRCARHGLPERLTSELAWHVVWVGVEG